MILNAQKLLIMQAYQLAAQQDSMRKQCQLSEGQVRINQTEDNYLQRLQRKARHRCTNHQE